MNQYAEQWWSKESPSFSYRCDGCGLMITGQSEKGVHTLVKRHKEKGIFHQESKGETVMPVPEGEITTSEILSTDEVVELAPDEEEDQS